MAAPRILYRIQPSNPNNHLFDLSCRVLDPEATGQEFRLPNWIPGSYMIREFPKHVVSVSAENLDGEELAVRKTSKDTWVVDACDQAIVLSYQVYAADPSVRGAWLDSQRGFFNGTSVFMEVVGQAGTSCSVEIRPPSIAGFDGWRVATSMRPLAGDRYAFGKYHASNYDELLDHPVEIGLFETHHFKVAGIRHELVISGQHDADIKRIADDLKVICNAQVDFYGGKFPDREYWFLLYANEKIYGGLEHRASTALMAPRSELLPGPAKQISDDYLNFLTLCSHEYFHTWNVKRMKPAAFTPYDLSQEVHTELLWVFEGCTVYYECLPLVRSGMISVEQYLRYLAQILTRVSTTPGRMRQTLLESSFDAWTKFYKQDENACNAIISYYAKGAMVALAIDLSLRIGSNNEFSLDHVMQAMWQKHGKGEAGLAEDEFELLLTEVTGIDLKPELDLWLRSHEDPPLATLLQHFGIDYSLRKGSSNRDKGGTKLASELLACGYTGATFCADHSGFARISKVINDSPAENAGLAAGDLIVAINGTKCVASDIDLRLDSLQPGTIIAISAFHGDQLLETKVQLNEPPADRVVLIRQESPTIEQTTLLNSWLKQ